MRPFEFAHRSARALRANAAFVSALTFYALVALPLARRELASWETRASAIRDGSVRALALSTLRSERMNSEGAAAFAMLHPPAARRLIPLLVAYQLTWDFVDTLLEQPAVFRSSAQELIGALESALLLDRRDYRSFRTHPFLEDLVSACRSKCAVLPRYEEARGALTRSVERTDSLLVTNAPPSRRARELENWARRHWKPACGLEPAELCAAAHCSLGIHALLAAAAKPATSAHDLDAVETAYFPWIDAICTLLDSVVDAEEDARRDAFNFFQGYPSVEYGVERLRMIAERAGRAAQPLPNGDRHMALLSAMVAMYASAAGAQAPHVRPVAGAVLDAVGPLSHRAYIVLSVRHRLGP